MLPLNKISQATCSESLGGIGVKTPVRPASMSDARALKFVRMQQSVDQIPCQDGRRYARDGEIHLFLLWRVKSDAQWSLTYLIWYHGPYKIGVKKRREGIKKR